MASSPVQTSFYSREELLALGFAAIGESVQISRKASFYGIGRIALGSHVRIDDFCVLSAGEGGIAIGSYVHIAVYTSLIGAGRIEVQDFCNLSSRVSVYSSNDDYSGASLTNPTIPEAFSHVSHAPVTLGRHTIIGSGSVVLPGVVCGEGTAIGSLSLVNRDCEAFMIYAGVPARPVKVRSRELLNEERRLLASLG